MAGFNKPYSKPQQSGSSFVKKEVERLMKSGETIDFDADNSSKSSGDSIQISGLYEGKPDSKLVLKGTLREAVTIPAGYQIKIFRKGGVSKNGKELPPFELVAQPARTMKKAD